jgi:hypothetical protein
MSLGKPPQPLPTAGITRRHPILPERWSVWFWRHLRRVVITVIGGTVLLMGVAMLVLPGPGWLTIFAGLGLLATEFAWARWLLKRARREVGQMIDLARHGLGTGTGLGTSTSKPPSTPRNGQASAATETAVPKPLSRE